MLILTVINDNFNESNGEMKTIDLECKILQIANL